MFTLHPDLVKKQYENNVTTPEALRTTSWDFEGISIRGQGLSAQRVEVIIYYNVQDDEMMSRQGRNLYFLVLMM